MHFSLDPIDQVGFCMHSKLNDLAYFVSSSIADNFSLASANWMFLVVAFVSGSIKISFVSSKISLKWLCTFRFCKVSVKKRMHVLPSRLVQYSCKDFNCTWNIFSSKSLLYIAITLYLCMKKLPLAAFNKRRKTSWSNHLL